MIVFFKWFLKFDVWLVTTHGFVVVWRTEQCRWFGETTILSVSSNNLCCTSGSTCPSSICTWWNSIYRMGNGTILLWILLQIMSLFSTRSLDSDIKLWWKLLFVLSLRLVKDLIFFQLKTSMLVIFIFIIISYIVSRRRDFLLTISLEHVKIQDKI